MSKERELIDKYNELINLYNRRTINDDNARSLLKDAYNTLFDLSNYERDNIGKIENPYLLDKTIIKGINNNYYTNSKLNKPLNIYPPSYQKLDNNKVMVIADIHRISKNVGIYKYHDDSINYFYAALKAAKMLGIKELVVLGDLVDGRYHHSNNELDGIINNKSYDELLNEVSLVSSELKSKLDDIKIRVVLGNHDLNTLAEYQHKYKDKDNYSLIDRGIDEYLSAYRDKNIKIDGVGNVIYRFGENNILFEHSINKTFGLYNPLKVEYKYEQSFSPSILYRSISGHSHYYSYRYWYYDRDEISNVICPCLKADYDIYQGSQNIIEHPGFLIIESINDKIIVEPYFIIKESNNHFYIDNLEELCKLSKNCEINGMPNKIKNYKGLKRIVLEKVMY